MKEGSTPLGINKPIKPCGLFPVVEAKQANDDMDTCAPSRNYASYVEHREGAEALLLRGKKVGWLEFFQSHAEAKGKYGDIVYSSTGIGGMVYKRYASSTTCDGRGLSQR